MIKEAALVPELLVQDIAESRRFYTEVLGFSTAYERRAQGFCYLTLGDAQIMLEQITDGPRSWINGEINPPLGRGMNLQIMVTDLSHIISTVPTEHIFHPLEEAWYETDAGFAGQTQIVVSDPDGYLLRFAKDLGTTDVPPAQALVRKADG